MDKDLKQGYLDKLKGKFFGLLKEREKDGQWEAFLETLQIEIMGLENELQSINYYNLCAKMATLNKLRFHYFRKTIFECMNLIEGLDKVYDE